MRALLDTHALLWWLHDSSRLSPEARAWLEDGSRTLLWSSVGTAEIAIKMSVGGLRIGLPLDELLTRLFRDEGFTPLRLEHAHAARLAELPLLHRDPFDRLLIAQGLAEDVPIVTRDAAFAGYGVRVIW